MIPRNSHSQLGFFRTSKFIDIRTCEACSSALQLGLIRIRCLWLGLNKFSSLQFRLRVRDKLALVL